MNPLTRITSALQRGRRSGKLVWALPNIILGLFVLAMFGFLIVLQRNEQSIQRNALAQDIQWAEQAIRTHLKSNEEFLQQVARSLADGSLDRATFQEQTNRHLANNPELTHIVWVDADQVVRWTAPFETTTWNFGEYLSQPEQTLTFQRASRTEQPAYSVPLVSQEGGARIEVHVPVQHERISRGTLVGIYDAQGMLRHLAPAWFWGKYRLVLETDERVIGANSSVEVETDVSGIVQLDPPGQGLRLRVSAYAAKSTVPQKMFLLLTGGLILLMAWSLWALRAHMQRRRKAERERDRLFNLSLDLLCVVRFDGQIVRANPAFNRILGLAPDILQGRSLLDLIHADDLPATQNEFMLLTRGKPESEFENRCRCADNSYRWLVWSVNPATDEGLFYCVAHDITNRKRAEDAIRMEYAFRKAMEESVMTGLRAIDLEGRIIYVNPAFCRMVGLEEQQLIGCRAPFPYWPPDEIALQQHNLQLTLEGKAPPSGFQIRIRHSSGEYAEVRIYVSPLIDGNGKQTGWMASMVDITEPMRTRAELLASHERFVAVLDGLDAAVYVADAQTDEILFANQSLNAIFGATAIGHNATDLSACWYYDPARLLRDPRDLLPVDVPCELFDGEVSNEPTSRWYHLRDRAIRWVDGRVVRMVIATDITGIKQIEDENLRQQLRLEQTSRLIAMGEMASTLAHELNQPLAAIANYTMGCATRMESGKYQREDVLAALQKASFQAERAGKIIRRMREFVKKSEPHCVPVSLASIIEDAIGFAEIEARKSGVEIRIEMPEILPPVFADRIMIEQVLLNLFKNGIEAMTQTPRNRRLLSICANLNEAGQVEIEVRDCGHGIDVSTAEQLFAPFFTTKEQGMGMGLNICRTIIEFHNGRMWVEANPEGGTVFRFTLPVGKELVP